MLDQDTGQRVEQEYAGIRPGTDPIADAEKTLHQAQTKAAEARAGQSEAQATQVTCRANRPEYAQRWLGNDPNAERLSRQNEVKLREAEDAEAMYAERVEAAEQVVEQARYDLERTYKRHAPDLVKQIVAEEIPDILAAKARAVAAAEELHALCTRLSKRCHPLRAAMIDWVDAHDRSNGKSRSDAEIVKRVNIPRPPISGFELNSLQMFDPRSEAMKLLLVDLEKQDAAKRKAAEAEQRPVAQATQKV